MTELPLIRDLHVLQLEQYWPDRYAKWVLSHLFDFSALKKTKLKETYKIRALILMYVLVLMLVYYVAIILLPTYLAVVLFVILNVWPVLILVPVVSAIKQGEKVVLWLVAKDKAKKLDKIEGLVRIGITGSWGKSSVKEYLFEILGKKAYTIKTPESYNTLLGVARVIDFELVSKVKYFLAEMGAYRIGDIAQTTSMVKPSWGILTAVGKQHMDRFKTIERVARAKFELVDGIENKSKVLVNWDNEYIKKKIERNDNYKDIVKYSFKDRKADFFVSGVKIEVGKTKFDVSYKNKKYGFETSLFGNVNVENLVAAIGMAMMLKIPVDKIKIAVAKIQATKNRLEVKRIGRAIVIDNTFSSNVTGFEKAIIDFGKLKGKRLLITPGIVELGKETKSTHQLLGKKAADVFDEIILVGESDRTRSLQVGIGRSSTKTKVWFLEDFSKYWQTVKKLAKKYDWILLENDVSENYD